MRAVTTKSPDPLSNPNPPGTQLYRALGALVPSHSRYLQGKEKFDEAVPWGPDGDLQRNVLACGDGDERLSGTSTLALRT